MVVFLSWVGSSIPSNMNPDGFLDVLMAHRLPKDPVEQFLNPESKTAISFKAMGGTLDTQSIFKQLGKEISSHVLDEQEDTRLSNALDGVRVGIAWSRATSHKAELEHLQAFINSFQE